MLIDLTSDEFKGEVFVIFYTDGEDIWVKRKTVGKALGYAHPGKSISKIHHRHKDILAANMILDKANEFDINESAFYNLKAIIDVCHISDQPNADWFKDWASTRINELKYEFQSWDNVKRLVK